MAVKKVEEFTVDGVESISAGWWYKNTEFIPLTFSGEGFKIETKLSLRDYKNLAARMAKVVQEMEGVEVESND